MSIGTAREKAPALSRDTNRRNEAELLDYSLHATATQVDGHCQQRRNAQHRKSTREAHQAHNARYLRRFVCDDGSITLSAHFAGDWYFRHSNGETLPWHPALTHKLTYQRTLIASGDAYPPPS
jgi:hypothetical protein